MRRQCLAILVFALAASISACKKDPEVAKREFFASGNTYFDQQKYNEAAVQYRNAVQQDPKFGEARLKLAETYTNLKDFRNAYREYIRAADLLPSNVDAQIKAGTLLLLGDQAEDARTRADKALALDPKNVKAQVLRANALAGMKDLDGAIKDINEAIRLDPSQASSYANLGELQLAQGHKAEAEAAFNKAVQTNPNDVGAQLAFANYLWSTGRAQDAEAALKKAAALDPKNLLANQALATFYAASNRRAEAEPYLKKYVELSGTGPAKLELADYYIGSNRVPDATTVLQDLAKDQQYFAEAKTRLAALAFAAGKHEEGHKIVDEVLAKQANNAQALLTKARFLLAEHKNDDALTKAKAAVTADPQSVMGHYLLGTIYANRSDPEGAGQEFREVLKLNPRAVPAQLQLAQLEMRRGAGGSSVQLAEQAVSNQPQNPIARLVLVKSLTAKGDLPRATQELDKLLKDYPNASPVHTQAGVLAMLRKDSAGARKEFEKAYVLDNKSIEALAGLCAIDVGSGKIPDALKRIDDQRQKTPKNAMLEVLAARTHIAAQDAGNAEAALRRAIEYDSGNLTAYVMLGQVYLSQKKMDQAVGEFESVTKVQPKNVAAHTMIGMILQTQGKNAEAQKKYEQIMTIDSRSPVAANNLAWIYAEAGTNLDQALQLAQTAQAALPEQPEVNDTLGFVYLKKDLATLAVPPLRVSVEKDPKNPVYHYRLGLAYSKTGDEAAARRELEASLKLSPSSPNAEDARKILANLKS
jgi:tetratricopeptide (TPR) repeat protein